MKFMVAVGFLDNDGHRYLCPTTVEVKTEHFTGETMTDLAQMLAVQSLRDMLLGYQVRQALLETQKQKKKPPTE